MPVPCPIMLLVQFDKHGSGKSNEIMAALGCGWLDYGCLSVCGCVEWTGTGSQLAEA